MATHQEALSPHVANAVPQPCDSSIPIRFIAAESACAKQDCLHFTVKSNDGNVSLVKLTGRSREDRIVRGARILRGYDARCGY
jgi:hypothetical protein